MWIDNDAIITGVTCTILFINSYLLYKRLRKFSYDEEKNMYQNIERIDSLNEDLEYYYQLFDAEIEELNRFIVSSFDEGSLTYIKFQTIIEEMKNVFDDEINSVNNLFILNFDGLNSLCDEKIERIKAIIEAAKQLNMEFINNQNKEDKNRFEEVIQETGRLKSSIKNYDLKPQYFKDICQILEKNKELERNTFRWEENQNW